MDLFPSGFPGQRTELTSLDLLDIWESRYGKLSTIQSQRFLKDAEESGLLSYSKEVLHFAFKSTPKFKPVLDYLEVIGALYYDQHNQYSEENEDENFQIADEISDSWQEKWQEEDRYFLWIGY